MNAGVWTWLAWAVTLAGVAALLVILVLLDRRIPRRGGSRLDEAHHGYWGGLLAIGILIALTAPQWVTAVVFVASLFLLYDDALLEHFRQLRAGDLSLSSPAWRVWRWVLTAFH